MVSFFVSLLLLLAPVAHAQTDPSIQSQLDAGAAQIQQLQAEIAQLQKQLDATSKQKQTLQNAVNEIALNIKKINTNITLTNAQITQKDKEIARLSGSISTTTDEIGVVEEQIDDSLRQLNMLDDEPIAASARKTGHLIVADYDWLHCGLSAEVATRDTISGSFC